MKTKRTSSLPAPDITPALVAALLAPQKAASVVLDRRLHAAQACAGIARSCLAQLAANRAGILASDNPEFIHQARVALRRLRSAFRLFRRRIDADFYARIDPELRWLAGVLGAARDWDVLGSQTVPRLLHPAGARRAGAGERALLKAIAAHRAACRAAACKALASRRYQQLLIAIARGLEAMEAAAEGRLGLAARAARELERAACRLRIRPRSLRAMDAEQRHRLRIHAKRLRYAVEFLGSLYAGKRVRRYELPLAELQDALGLLNDNAVALSLFSALALPGTALQALQRSLQAGTDEQLDHAVGALRRLAKARPFWTG